MQILLPFFFNETELCVQEQLRWLRLEREPVHMHKVPIIPLGTSEAEKATILTTPPFPLPVSSSSKLFSVIFPAHLLLGDLPG